MIMSDIETIASEISEATKVEAEALAALQKMSSGRPTIAVVNASTSLSDAEADAAMPGFQGQISEDFAPHYGDAELVFVPKGAKAKSDVWQAILLENSDQADALGYHDLTIDGLPISKSFIKSDIDAGMKWTITASHEICEERADPWICEAFVISDGRGGMRLVAKEPNDACEDDQFGYQKNGVWVSDFVLPSWFQPGFPKAIKFDFMGHITSPMQILSGGYIGVNDVSSGSGWMQLTAEMFVGGNITGQLLPAASRLINMKSRGPVGSRRERRRTPRSQWRRSTR